MSILLTLGGGRGFGRFYVAKKDRLTGRGTMVVELIFALATHVALLQLHARHVNMGG